MVRSFLAALAPLLLSASAIAQEPPADDQCAAPGDRDMILPQSGLAIALPMDAPAGEGSEAAPCDALLPAPPPRPPAPDIFGSVALPVASTPMDTRWQGVTGRTEPTESGALAELVRLAAADDPAARLARVNGWVNAHVAFADDGPVDHWQDLAETMARGRGDCEDYAIAKMQLLQAAGVPAGDMYLVIVTDMAHHADHAVLAVRQDGRLLVLDNRTDRILPSEAIADYSPLVSFSTQFAWTHGYRSARAADTLERLAPGGEADAAAH